MSDTLTPERITQLRGLGAYQGGLLKTELDALLDAAEELHAIENRAENPTCKRCIKVRVHSLEDDRDRLASENATLRAELATWKHRAGNKWSQHDIDQAKKIGKLTNDLFAAYAERDAALAEVTRLKASAWLGPRASSERGSFRRT